MKKHFWGIFIAICILAAVIVALASLESTIEVEHQLFDKTPPLVSVVNRKAGEHQGEIRVYATVQPKWEITINAPVGGEVIKTSDSIRIGARVETGDILLQLENSAYQLDVAIAEQAISEAKLRLLLAKKQAELAKRDWQQSGISKNPPPLALKQPQLDVATKTLNTAKSQLTAAHHRLAQTTIKAPFSGVVSKWHVSQGQILAQGEAVLHLIDDKHLEISTSLSPAQWQLLPNAAQEQLASIQDRQGREIAQARLTQTSHYIDSITHQYPIHLQIVSGSKIVPGEFIQVVLTGTKTSQTLMIPETALTREGLVWYVDESHSLQNFEANIVYYRQGQVIIKRPNQIKTDWQIAITPLAAFVMGDQVKIQMSEQ